MATFFIQFLAFIFVGLSWGLRRRSWGVIIACFLSGQALAAFSIFRLVNNHPHDEIFGLTLNPLLSMMTLFFLTFIFVVIWAVLNSVETIDKTNEDI